MVVGGVADRIGRDTQVRRFGKESSDGPLLNGVWILLVLSRQRDEAIIVGDDIQIVVVDIRGDKCRLGVNAPASMRIDRKEVRDAINREGLIKPLNTNEGVQQAADEGYVLTQLVRISKKYHRRASESLGGPSEASRARFEEITGFLRELDALVGNWGSPS